MRDYHKLPLRKLRKHELRALIVDMRLRHSEDMALARAAADPRRFSTRYSERAADIELNLDEGGESDAERRQLHQEIEEVRAVATTIFHFEIGRRPLHPW